jgi:F-type H+-transporting ATPase subunit a
MAYSGFVHIPLQLGPLDLSITDHVVLLWIAAGLTFVLLTLGARKLAAAPGAPTRFTSLVESLVDFVRENVAEAFLGEHARKWFGFVAALFFFILFCNLLGKLPVPGFESPTGNINVTAALAVLVFLVAQGVGIYKLGPIGYFKKKFLMPAPLVIKIFAIPIMFLVLLAEPFSLAVRLFANMTAGHQVIAVIMAGLIWLSEANLLYKLAVPIPFAFIVAMLLFELFIAFIQAFIFALLSALYLSESLEEHH